MSIATAPTTIEAPALEPVSVGGLWVLGDPAVLQRRCVGVVGSRRDHGFATRIAEVVVEAVAALNGGRLPTDQDEPADGPDDAVGPDAAMGPASTAVGPDGAVGPASTAVGPDGAVGPASTAVGPAGAVGTEGAGPDALEVDGTFGPLVDSVAVWVRLSPAGAERKVVAAAAELGVPVVALCAVGTLAPPAALIEQVLASGGAVVSTLPGDAPSTDESTAARDALLASAPAALVAVDGTLDTAPDTAALIGTAFEARTPVVAPRPRTGHRRGADALMSQVLSGNGKLSRLGLSAAQVALVARFDAPANAVCESPAEVAAALEFYLRWGGPPELATVTGVDAPEASAAPEAPEPEMRLL